MVFQNSQLKPEEQARLNIDRWLEDAGWAVVSRKEYTEAINAIALKENLMQGNLEADYLLYLNGKAIGVLEAKKKDNRLGDDVWIQAVNYTSKLTDKCQFWLNPIPFVFISNGETLLFRDLREPENQIQDLNCRMLTPKQLFDKSGCKDEFARLPAVMGVGPGKLRQCQHDAVTQVELAFKRDTKRCLLNLATGSGKTFTACMMSYRFLNYTNVKHILYLVDRNNLGKQTLDEYGKFKLTESGNVLSSIFSVNRLKKAEEAEKYNVTICTIQRLFSVITGQSFTESDDSEDDQNEEETLFSFDDEDETAPAVELGGNLKISNDLFDLVIIDECHRSIYGRWRKVLEYFSSARFIGLTATPTPLTYAFFDCADEEGNYKLTMQYTQEQSYVDGVNVPPIIYRIQTRVTDEGGEISKNDIIKEINKRTDEEKTRAQGSDKKYSKADLDRSVVNQAQILTIIREFRDKAYDVMFPDREKNWFYFPKTLIFAKTDKHADQIIEAIRTVFSEVFEGRHVPDNFVQKITHTEPNPNQLINNFRVNRDFRIAVTVTLVATGTDVKPLEIVFFMRDIHSETLYTQMKGRGCRSISDDELQKVTPNATTKENYILLDAVGVTESEKNILPGGDGGGEGGIKFTLEKVLEWLAHGEVSNVNLNYLAEKLSAIKNRTEEIHLQEFYDLAKISLENLARDIFTALEDKNFPPYFDINDKNTERKKLVSKLIDNPKAREFLLQLQAGYLKILNNSQDQLLYSGFSIKDSEEYVSVFENYVKEHKDELEALRILYHDEHKVITPQMLNDLYNKLVLLNPVFREFSVIWDAYNTLSSNNKIDRKVSPLKNKTEKQTLTNLIQLVRFAYGKTEALQAINGIIAQRFNLYIGQHLGDVKRDFTPEQVEILRRLADYVAQKGCVTRADFRNDNQTSLFVDVLGIYKMPHIDEELDYFSTFILDLKAA